MGIFSQDYWASAPDTVTAVTPHDTNALPKPAKGLYVTVSGNVALVTTGGSSVTLPVTAGQVLSLQVKQVKATGTTATVVALN